MFYRTDDKHRLPHDAFKAFVPMDRLDATSTGSPWPASPGRRVRPVAPPRVKGSPVHTECR